MKSVSIKSYRTATLFVPGVVAIGKTSHVSSYVGGGQATFSKVPYYGSIA